MNDRILTTKEAAAMLRISPSTLREWAAKRTIPHFRLGPKTLRFRTVDLEEFLLSRAASIGEELSENTSNEKKD